MTDDTNTDAWIEAQQPVFIASQLRPGHTLTDADVTAIQAVLSELNNREETDVEIFHNGRIAGFHEIGGQALVDAVARKENVWINKQVRKAMDQMDAANGRPTKVQRLQTALQAVADCKTVQRATRIAREALAQEFVE